MKQINYDTKLFNAIDSADFQETITLITQISNDVKNEEEKNEIFAYAIEEALEKGAQCYNNINEMIFIINEIVETGFKIDKIQYDYQHAHETVEEAWNNRTGLEFEPTQEQYESRDEAFHMQCKLNILDQAVACAKSRPYSKH